MDILHEAYDSTDQVGSSGNTTDLYSACARFDSPPRLSLLRGFPGFPQFIQANNGTVPQITERPLPPTSLWPTVRCYTSICLKRHRKTTKNFIQGLGVRAEIQMGHFQNASLKRYCLRQLVRSHLSSI